MNLTDLKRYGAVFWFLLRFVGIYFLGNLIYGFYVAYYEPHPDPMTHTVTVHTATALRWLGYDTWVQDSQTSAITILMNGSIGSLHIYEGCSGINLMIVFVAFLAGWGSGLMKTFYFIPFGLLIIHFANILRLGGLFLISVRLPEWFYFVHKYLFTAVLFLVVFLLWIIWIRLTRKASTGS